VGGMHPTGRSEEPLTGYKRATTPGKGVERAQFSDRIAGLDTVRVDPQLDP
jgi:hypothetical protein